MTNKKSDRFLKLVGKHQEQEKESKFKGTLEDFSYDGIDQNCDGLSDYDQDSCLVALQWTAQRKSLSL